MSSIAELENVHVRAAKLIHKIPSSVPNHQVLENAKWKSISYLYKRRLSCIAFQCYYGLSHEAINSLMVKKKHTRSMRDNLKVKLGRPRSETGRQTFRRRAAIIWNALPEGVKCSPNYNSVKFALKKTK